MAKLLGLTENTVKSVFAQFRAEKRAERLGVHFNGSITDSDKAMLGQRSEKLIDRPFAEIAKLTQEAGLTSDELLRDPCNRVQDEAGSEDAKLAGRVPQAGGGRLKARPSAKRESSLADP